MMMMMVMMMIIIMCIVIAEDNTWRFLDSYPAHYVTRELSTVETIKIDGNLDEEAWENVPWTEPMVDITRHQNEALNAVPQDVQVTITRVGFRVRCATIW